MHTVDLSPIEVDGLLSEYFKDHRSITCARMQQVCGMTRSTAYRRLQTLTQGEHPSLQREGYKMPLPTYRLKGITDVPTPQIAGNESDRVKGGFVFHVKRIVISYFKIRKMKRTILKDVGIGLCFLLSTGTIYAQNYPRKVKNAQGIEVTYQSNYKGRVRPDIC